MYVVVFSLKFLIHGTQSQVPNFPSQLAGTGRLWLKSRNFYTFEVLTAWKTFYSVVGGRGRREGILGCWLWSCLSLSTWADSHQEEETILHMERIICCAERTIFLVKRAILRVKKIVPPYQEDNLHMQTTILHTKMAILLVNNAIILMKRTILYIKRTILHLKRTWNMLKKIILHVNRTIITMKRTIIHEEDYYIWRGQALNEEYNHLQGEGKRKILSRRGQSFMRRGQSFTRSGQYPMKRASST